MTSRTLRRRLLHGDVEGRRHEDMDERRHEDMDESGLDGLSEPLLGRYEDDDDDKRIQSSEVYTLGEIWDIERKREQLHWSILFSHVIVEWAQWLANIVLGTGSLLGRLLSLPSIRHNGLDTKCIPVLSPVQEIRLRDLKQRLEVPFDGSRIEHQDGLRQLWKLAYPGRELPALKSELWKEMGWQGSDPSTDFRGGGFISLENLIFFAKKYPDSFRKLLNKQEGKRAEWEYPFAVAGINISFMLIQMLDLQSAKPYSPAGIRFVDFLSEDEMAFDDLYCVAFEMMDAQWLAKRASYMEFNEVLKSTKTQLERELALEDVSCVKDLPAYNLVRK